jgi:hypothetical protein
VKEVSNLIPVTTNREWHFLKEWDLGSHGGGEKGLTETSRPGLISTMRSDLSQTTHRFIPKDKLGVILFL